MRRHSAIEKRAGRRGIILLRTHIRILCRAVIGGAADVLTYEETLPGGVKHTIIEPVDHLHNEAKLITILASSNDHASAAPTLNAAFPRGAAATETSNLCQRRSPSRNDQGPDSLQSDATRAGIAYEAELASFPRSISIGWYQFSAMSNERQPFHGASAAPSPLRDRIFGLRPWMSGGFAAFGRRASAGG
jgi:hypothetical protein